jgi:hypothetical protein
MTSNPKKLVRFFSDQGQQNYSYINEENETKKKSLSSIKQHFQEPPIEPVQQPKKNFFRQLSSKAEQKIDVLEAEAQQVSEVLQSPTFTRVLSIQEDQTDDIIVTSHIPPHTLVETGLSCHRDMKSGSQRFRWNLLFNLLLWLIVPLPFWIPFVSNTLAFYLLPSIQGVFVFMWTSNSRLF